MGKANILMVEDNPGDVKLIQKALDQTTFIQNVDVATDGAEALDYLTKKNNFSDAPTPDIVLLDSRLSPTTQVARVQVF